MKPPSESSPTLNSTFLTASILLAQIDMHGLLDYGLKAALGGAVWLCYKIIADRLDRMHRSKEPVKP